MGERVCIAGKKAMSIFRWDTIRVVASHDLNYRSVIKGNECEIEILSGRKIAVWMAEGGHVYFCHGLTFGGKDCPHGSVSPYSGKPVQAILADLYIAITEMESRMGDILVWNGDSLNATPHSAMLVLPQGSAREGILNETSRLQSKNGMLPEVNLTLAELFEEYGESYTVFRKREF